MLFRSRAAEEERRSVLPTDRFHAVLLEETTHLELLQTLATQSDLESAWLAEKEMRHQPDRRLFVLVKRRGWLDRIRHERSAAVARGLSAEVSLPGQTLVIPCTGGLHKLTRAIREIPRSQLAVVHTVAR